MDSSPQFARDYLVAECDYVNLESVYSLNPGSTLSSLVWSTRVLPIQVLGRKATSTAHKYRALLRMLHLETGSVDLAKSRTCSFLNDMGVESKLAILPDLDGDRELTRRAFPNTLPLHDLDHALHHVMEELRDCWDSAMFDLFEKQLNTLAKYFSKADARWWFQISFSFHSHLRGELIPNLTWAYFLNGLVSGEKPPNRL